MTIFHLKADQRNHPLKTLLKTEFHVFFSSETKKKGATNFLMD